MEAQQTPLLMDMAEPGVMVHQPRIAVDENTLAEMRASLGLAEQPIMQTMPMARPAQQRDMLPIYLLCGMGCVLMTSCVAMVAIANNPSAQVARANEQMAAVAIAANERATCEINALVALPGACPVGEAVPQQQQQQQAAVVPYAEVANTQPLPADVPPPPAPNPFLGMTKAQLEWEWANARCTDPNQSQVCVDISNAAQAIAAGGQ